MKARKVTTMLAAAGLAMAPVASANAAASLSIARAATPAHSVSYLDDDESNHGGGSTAVILGVILIVLIGAAAIAGNSGSP